MDTLQKGSTVSKIFVYAVLGILGALMMVPFYWMAMSSLKLDHEVFAIPTQWWPSNPVWENYINIWVRIPLLTFIRNSAYLTIVVTTLQLITSNFAAYAFSKLRFPGQNVMFLLYVASIAVPWQAYMVPQFIMFRQMDLVNTHMSMIILQAFTAFGVFLTKQFYDSIPNELLESARIDGMTEYQIWRRIMLPLSKPVLATLTILTFVFVWNDFLGPRIYLMSQHLWTLQIGMRMFVGQFSSEFALIMAVATVSLIPVFIVFLALQKFFVQGISTTGLKG